MVKFLHLGDIHVGYRQYKLIERERDFFKAFLDICEKGAIQEQVDFVLVAGDLFNYRSISPQSFNEAVFVFNKLKQANIPVIAIEGNHDFKEINNFNNLKGSWYEALAQNQLIYFLYPQNEDQAFEKLIINKKYLGGGYIDLNSKGKNIRIIGSKWHGFNAGSTLRKYKKRIEEINENDHRADFQIFMFHGGHENYLPVNRGGVSSNDFYCLQDTVNYIALGHIHEHYCIQNQIAKDFILNPGSTEANSTAETDIQRGGIVAEIKADNSFDYSLLTNYYQRKFIKLDDIDASKFSSLETLISFIKEDLENKISNCNDNRPIIQVNIIGRAKFDKSNEELSLLKDYIEGLGALYCLVKWDVQDEEITYIREEQNSLMSRQEQESSILKTILSSDEDITPEDFSSEMLQIKDLIINRNSESTEVLHQLEAFADHSIKLTHGI